MQNIGTTIFPFKTSEVWSTDLQLCVSEINLGNVFFRVVQLHRKDDGMTSPISFPTYS